ncbi:DUF7768 domain-containing protein [Paenarthrobacter nitroguajacolicus]|uniref:DUF7768 domain-containing protein n=1 Tax=Paenarthrobacter nitroguajacolicus TaxID=211146 RepID=UPI0015BC116C|nr:hypothetical protein [Paenarthrobacter nitroguajacolicus]NWL34457.1 hypothetical protein [Paenarthrobacter nitroguajacolicus]
MKLVIVESPYAGDIAANETYARRALADSLARGEASFASHLLYTQRGILDDANPEQRKQGIAAGFAWGEKADLTASYVDRGTSTGIEMGITAAKACGRPVEFRSIGASA